MKPLNNLARLVITHYAEWLTKCWQADPGMPRDLKTTLDEFVALSHIVGEIRYDWAGTDSTTMVIYADYGDDGGEAYLTALLEGTPNESNEYDWKCRYIIQNFDGDSTQFYHDGKFLMP